MTKHTNVEVGCLFVGEFVDENDLQGECSLSRGEAVRPRVIAEFLDLWAKPEAEVKEFTVLLKEKGMVKVRGRGLKWIQAQHRGEGGGVFAVVDRSQEGEVIVAMFRNDDVIGIFNGVLQSTAQIA
jgi:hypothetical protein